VSVSVEAKVVPRLGAALAGIEHAVVLALDDLHLLHDTQCLDALAALGRHVPAGSQLALAARGGPALPPAALRTRGLAHEIGSGDLRMDAEQAARLVGAAGVDLPAVELAELWHRGGFRGRRLAITGSSLSARALECREQMGDPGQRDHDTRDGEEGCRSMFARSTTALVTVPIARAASGSRRRRPPRPGALDAISLSWD
jgi:hypothetical protein